LLLKRQERKKKKKEEEEKKQKTKNSSLNQATGKLHFSLSPALNIFKRQSPASWRH
jgi:hypothetical protein